MNSCSTPRWPYLGAALGALCLFLTGCPIGAALDNPDAYQPGTGAGGAGVGGSGSGGTQCDLQQAFVNSCSNIICHGDPDDPTKPPAAGELDLLSPTLEADLINMPAKYVGVSDPENCPDPPELLIDQANPANSLMITKLNGNFACGKSMPDAMVPITDEDRACIIQWATGLAEGAP